MPDGFEPKLVYDEDVAGFDEPPAVELAEPEDWEQEPQTVELAASTFDNQGVHVSRVQNSGWKPATHPRLTHTVAGQRGGSFIDNASITKQLTDLGRSDLSSMGAGSQHINHVEITKTQNADQTLMKVGLHLEGQPGNFNVYLYVPTKNLQPQRLQSILVGLNNGLPINDLAKKNAVHTVSSDPRFYSAYTQFVRSIASRKSGASLAEGGKKVREIAELFCAESTIEQADGLIWKCALPVGELKLTPGHRGVPRLKPLKVIEGHSPNAREAIGLADILGNFEKGAVQHVTLPTTHEDRPEDNTGFVRKLKLGKLKDGRTALFAGVDITEPDIKGKVTRGSIANCSVGIEFDYVKKDTGETFNAVLQHLNLTNKPWVPGMPGFGVAASEDAEITSLLPAEAPSEMAQWKEERGLFWRLDKAQEALRAVMGDFVVNDIDSQTVFITDDTAARWQVPYMLTTEGKLAVGERELWQPLAVPSIAPGDIPDDEPTELAAQEPGDRALDATPLKGAPDDISKPWESNLLDTTRKPTDFPRPVEPPWGPTTGVGEQLSEAQAKRRLRLHER